MRRRTLKFPAKAKTAIYGVTAGGFAFQAFNSDFPSFSSYSLPIFPEKIRLGIQAVVRSSRAISTISCIVLDYKYSLHGLSLVSDEYRRRISEVHLRSAERILKLCEANRGFYVKAGQFVAAMRQIPKEYSSTLSSLQDQAAPCHFEAIKEVLIRNLGQDLSEIFLSVDEKPVAAASIAQVHHAVLRSRQEVAIKVQYPGIEQQMHLDTSTMYFLSKCIGWLFPEYRFERLASEFGEAISLELDFIQEAKNSERTAMNFRSNKTVKVPCVFWEFTTSQVLTMEFCGGHKVDDVGFMNQMGINPVQVAKVLVEVFAAMIFIHGFLHGDLHPGNILVSPEGPQGFSLVLLDHGICKKLDEGFRQDYCQLWKALILSDSKKILYLGEQFGLGKYSRYIPLIFTGRTIDSKAALGRGMSIEEKKTMKQELKSLKMEDISTFMEVLPPDFLTILRTDGQLRSVISKLGVSQQIRLLAYAKYAVRGLSPKLDPETDFAMKVAFSSFLTNISYLQLRLVIEAAPLLQKIKKVLCTLYRKIRGIFWGFPMLSSGQ